MTDSRARVCPTPSRICWLHDTAYVVEEECGTEYASVVRLRKAPATRDEIDEWKFSTTKE